MGNPAGYSPERHSASCLRGEGCERPPVWPSAAPGRSARCSSLPSPVGRLEGLLNDPKAARRARVAALLTLYEKTSVSVMKRVSSAATEGSRSLSST